MPAMRELISHRIEEEIAQLAGMQTRQQLLSKLQRGNWYAHDRVGTLESRLQRNIHPPAGNGQNGRAGDEGGNTLIDSGVLNKAQQGLLHLRNASNHGRLPAERRLGKSEVARLRWSFCARPASGAALAPDDGRGLDLLARFSAAPLSAA